jgi:hypothetical protein
MRPQRRALPAGAAAAARWPDPLCIDFPVRPAIRFVVSDALQGAP